MLQSGSMDDNVEMAVWSKQSISNSVHLIPPTNPFFRFIANIIMKFGSRIGLDGLAGFGGWILPFYDFFKRADVIHLHLIHGFSNFSILSLPMLATKKPLVWTIHDPWASTGGCEHSFECNRWITGCFPQCPHPRCRSIFQHYTPFLQWKIKKWVYRRTNISIIVASQWLKSRLAQSPLLKHLPCHHIPFGIDLELFKPRPKNECRKSFNIPPHHKVLAFRDPGLRTDRYKGMRYLFEALQILEPREPISLLIFEDGKGFNCLSSKYNIVTPGWIDGLDIANALAASDVFIMPSIQEAFGLMAVEAMACGTPVIVFEGTALPDVIKAPLGGISVLAKDSQELANAIDCLLNDDTLRIQLGIQARQIAETEYSFTTYMETHMRLYKELNKDFNNKSTQP